MSEAPIAELFPSQHCDIYLMHLSHTYMDIDTGQEFWCVGSA